MRFHLRPWIAVFALSALVGGGERASAGIEIGGTIITPVEDPHYQVLFDFVLQPGTMLSFGDTMTVGPLSYINPMTGEEIEQVLIPYLGFWAGKFVAIQPSAPHANIFEYKYVGDTPFVNDTPDPIVMGGSAPGYQFGIFTINLPYISDDPELGRRLLAPVVGVSVTSDPDDPQRKIVFESMSRPAFAVPEPSTLISLLAAAPVGAWLAARRRRAA